MVDIKMIALTYDLHRQYVAENDVAETTEDDEKKNIEDLSAKVEQVTVGENTEDTKEEEIEENEESEDSAVSEGSESSESSESFDEDGWITQDNIEETLKKLGAFEIEENMLVGCLTTDFALQNVLLAMNLSLVSLSGYRIRKLKSFVLRCRTCFSTTSVMTKEFCPACGHKTLHKCAVSVDEDGNQQLHINWNRMANRRGLVYTLANPKGGKHATNERLFEDQPMPHMRMAKIHMDPLADGPFSVHDVTSRSAMLGVRTINNRAKQNRNPNESKRGGRRK
ncbi:RNA-binding protein NOB1 [Caenorhabditis elegans]|nr:RNA-binding protein NOB1 [Caenorhabditis elegans]CAJ1466077.1 RNA-binding protein NOB1 [Caenorhabditis elegans]